ncbi:hypothetical protein BCV69DRAFT_280493 [Microstroma glucosiphilum]|uniref:RING-type domain-containing protein n=1 Tax=Pseudomicrostroma glucosiphilum TaxID=1684307 RepID=A0A316UCD1_9BASI|nr:hypothetical protein BCV69DRAFT_280493 [Pseudomicrostroma glucosiphilum]PWN22880.1 hypothetical protein BCV69DRAFT_280493 [Pseudomicrostroma glucosiphilum]
MGRHSKNNTARANFTSTEYQYLKDRWGSKSSRLGGDSMRNFDQCALCLGTAVDPMTCKEGHLFCKECIYTNLLEQKADIKAHQVSLLKLAQQQEEERERAREHARAKVLSDFERNVGFGAGLKDEIHAVGEDGEASSSRKRKADSDAAPSGRLSLASLPERAQRLTQQAEDEALEALEAEQKASRRRKLPSFWLPSLMPSEKEGDVDLNKVGSSLEPRCRVENEHGHSISIKSLTPVKFSRAPTAANGTASNASEASSSSSSNSPIICPSCKKAISNSHRLFTVRRCSHTFCNSCAESLIYAPAKAALKAKKEAADEDGADAKKSSASDVACCPECAEGRIRDVDKDVIKLFREGTGYAASGGAEAKKKGIAFQG